jgi:hypothetical protein
MSGEAFVRAWRLYVCAIAILCAGVGVSFVSAIGQSLRGNALGVSPEGTDATGPGSLWVRYYRAGFPVANPSAGTCSTGLSDLGGNQRCCAGPWKSVKGGYQGHIEDAFDFGNAPSGTRFFSTYGLEQNGGTTSHVGYYA